MYSTKTDSMTIPVQVHMWHKKTEVETLLDSGATHNFIDERTVKALSMGTHDLPQPHTVTNVDGSENRAGTIRQYANLWVKKGTQTIKLCFFIANIGHDRIILGHPWFKAFNPTIDWTTNTLLGENVHIETASYHRRKAPAENNGTTVSPPPSLLTPIPPQIPEEYRHHAQVFSKEASQRFPPARQEDHVITLKPDTPPTFDCKVYAQTLAEEEATKRFIDEHLKKGYIVESNSQYASPFFFRKKKDNTLRPIMDYRVLNSWTVRDTYPLPLINTIIEKLQGKKLFTKFDIRWGYENIRIREEDQHKAAFKTPLGLFQPCVMFFGLTNSPATFSRTMARMF
jgi:hypothetical protein